MTQLVTKFITDGAVTGAKVETNVSLAGSPTTTTQSANDNSTKISTTAYVDAAVSAFQDGFTWQTSAKDYVTDNTAVPATEVSGDRYILSHDGGAPHANYDGASAGDIVEFNGTTWDAVTPTVSFAIVADDELDGIYIYGGASWSKKGFEATTGGTGTTLNVNAIDVNVDGSSIEINGSDQVSIKALGVDTAELADAAVTELKIDSGVDAQTFAATHTAVNYTPAQVGSEGTTKVSAHLKGLDTAIGSLTVPTANKEPFTLDATDVDTNGYIDLANVALASSISFLPEGGPEQVEVTDYTVSLTGGAGGNTRITFAGDLATGGDAALIATDKLVIKYDYEA